jgi:DNA (cytosine-5)-methyltransferase 1
MGRRWNGQVDCLAGGPSCQGFSTIGGRNPADPRNELIFEFARLVGEVRPKFFVLENVPGLLSTTFSDSYERLIRILQSHGYSLGTSPWKLDASKHGVPQKRLRVFLVGSLGDGAQPDAPASSDVVSSGDAIADFAAIARFPQATDVNELTLTESELAVLGNRSSSYARGLRLDHADGDLSTPRVWDRRVLTGVAGTAHSPGMIQRLAALPPGQRDSQSKLPRLDLNKPSPTLRAGTGRDHGSHTTVRPVHYESPRVITVREAARLHSFPDWFRFHTTRWHALRQIGNSVPPGMARAVGRSIIASMSVAPRRRPRVDLGHVEGLALTLEQAAEVLGIPRSALPPTRRKIA